MGEGKGLRGWNLLETRSGKCDGRRKEKKNEYVNRQSKKYIKKKGLVEVSDVERETERRGRSEMNDMKLKT